MEKAREIRTAYAAGGVTMRELSHRYGCSDETVRHVIRNIAWREEAA
jgi:Mor family transcriptional regulator